MIKGTQKNIIFLKNTGSEFFDEAYFVIKPTTKGKREEDIVAEANRIIQSSFEDGKKARKRRVWLGAFMSGAILGACCAVGICLMII